MKLLTSTFILLAIFLTSSCAIIKDSDFSKIAIGMSKDDFLLLNLNPRIIGSKKYNDGFLEIYERIDFKHYPAQEQRHYWFYFYNNILEEWGPKENFVPNEYDKYYKEYIKKTKNEKEQD